MFGVKRRLTGEEIMIKVTVAVLIAATVIPARAQLFSSESVGGALVGGLAGGLIAGRHHAGEGIAIGAGAGLVLGALASGYERRYDGPYAPAYYESRPNYAVTGTIVGGVAGGLIGGASRHTGAGIAIGAGTGLLLGSVAESEARRRAALTPYYFYSPQPVYVVAAPPATGLPAAPTFAQATTSGAEGGSAAPTAMSGANSLFGR